MSKIGNTKNPFTVVSVSSTLGEGLKIDNTLTFFDALGLAWRLRSFNPEPRGCPPRAAPPRVGPRCSTSRPTPPV